MDCFYGDGYLCQVEKRDADDFENLPLFKVVSICNEVDVVNKFFDEFHPDIDKYVS
jgi:hypothetical protein